MSFYFSFIFPVWQSFFRPAPSPVRKPQYFVAKRRREAQAKRKPGKFLKKVLKIRKFFLLFFRPFAIINKLFI